MIQNYVNLVTVARQTDSPLSLHWEKQNKAILLTLMRLEENSSVGHDLSISRPDL